MKISIGSNIIKGPWGGGNQFAINLSNYLKNRGWEVKTDLKDRDIDIILMTEPRKYSSSGNYNQLGISKYLILNPRSLVIHRINNCDKGRDTRNLNKYLTRANKVADSTIFISNYLKNIFINGELIKNKNFTVVMNGADSKLFNKINRKRWNKKDKLKIVTHHWSNNYNKGFDIYKELDRISLLGVNSTGIDFCYIGNIPENFRFKNTKIIPPLKLEELVREIKKNHVYITAAKGEGAGMHHIEAALCGLPILYRNSGALPEYCKGFGVIFEDTSDFKDKLNEIIEKYDYYFSKMKEYPYNANLMCQRYESVFLELLRSKYKLNKNKRRFEYLIIFLKETFLCIRDITLNKLKRLTERVFK